MAVAIVITTTFGGWGTHNAAAAIAHTTAPSVATAAPVPKLSSSADVIEAVFGFGDLLNAVGYQLSFEPGARDAAALDRSCGDLRNANEQFELAAARAKDVGDRLRGDAGPVLAFCLGSSNEPENAYGQFVSYREHAFELKEKLAS